MQNEHAGGEYGERAETYLRLLVEAALRPAPGGDASRVYRAADILVDAGALTGQDAAGILAGMEQALRVRGRPHTRPMAISATGMSTRLRRPSPLEPPEPPGQAAPWRVLAAGPATPGSRLMALILTANRVLAPATLFFPADIGPRQSDVPALATLRGTDDLGTSYGLWVTGGSWAGSAWTGTVMFHPAPPKAARWLAVYSPGGQLLRADLTVTAASELAAGIAIEAAQESPGERLLTRRAEAMLAAFAMGTSPSPRDVSSAEAVSTLEAAGALSPLSAAPARLTALGYLLGVPTKGQPPVDEVPARWKSVMAYYGRRRQLTPVTGTAAIGAALPEFDGARFAIAGLRSGGAGTFLHAVAQGSPGIPLLRRAPGPPVDSGFSLWLRDDADCWHLAKIEDVSPAGGPEGLLRFALLPPLAHATTTLTVELTGWTQQVTATLPVRW